MMPSEPPKVTAIRAKINELTYQTYNEWIESTTQLLDIDLYQSKFFNPENGIITFSKDYLCWENRIDGGIKTELEIRKFPTLVVLLLMRALQQIMIELNETENLISYASVNGPPNDWTQYSVIGEDNKNIPAIWADAVSGVVCVYERTESGKIAVDQAKPKKKILHGRIVIAKHIDGERKSFF